MRDCFFQERSSRSATAKLLAHIEADLRRPAVSSALNKGMEAKPAGDLTTDLRDPKRIGICRMFAKPRQALLNRNLLQLRSRNSTADGFVVDLDDRWKVRFQRVADDHAARIALSDAGVVWKKMLSKVG